MNLKFDRRAARKFASAAISTIGVASFSPASMAQGDSSADEVRRLITPESEVTIGAIDVTKSSYKFGDYTGLQNKGSHLIGDVRLRKRGEGSANYLDIDGSNLGLDSRSIRIRGGEQGNYGLSLEYDQIHKLWSDSYQSPYRGVGSGSLTLPAGWVTGTTTATMTALAGSMQSFNIETQRRSIAVGLTKLLPGDWDVAVDFKHETKHGNRLMGGIFGTSGGNPRGAVLPEPVDYVTRQFDIKARYNTEKLQLQLAYFGSLFDNKLNSLTFQNAYSSAVWIANTGYPNGVGQMGLPPDNQAHQFNAALGYQFTKDTRLAGSVSVGRMMQNESYLPYTANALLTSPLALPRSSLDGRVNTTHLDMKVTSKLDPKLNLMASYRYDDRANKTPQALYTYIGADAANQVAAGTASDRHRWNLPGSSTKHQIDIEADYKLAAHTKLKVGYEFDFVKKTFEAITSEREQTYKTELHQHFNESTTGGVSYAYSNRQTSAYNASAPFYATFTPAYIATFGAASLQWDNNPFQKKFMMAPRLRDKLRGFLNFEPMPKLDMQVAVDYKNDNYKESFYGLKKNTSIGEHFSANYAPSDAFTARAFLSFDRSVSNERSNTLAAGCGGKANPTNNACEWGAAITDGGLTAGFGMTFKPTAKYELGFDYARSDWSGKTEMSAGATLVQPTPLPFDKSTLDRFDLFGRYQLDRDISLNVKYIYERYRSNDWAVDGVVQNTLANVIGTNQTSPNYNVHAVGVSLSYQFQ